MRSIEVSIFKGFSKPIGNMSLSKKLEEIAGEEHKQVIRKMRQFIGDGKLVEASNVKRQLPGFTLSAIYEGKRRAEGLTGYNDILILDFDKLPEEEIIRCSRIIRQAPYTLFCFRSPSDNGLKAGVYFHNPEVDRLRKTLFAQQEVSTPELEVYHRKVFEVCRKHYETLTGVAIDGSGSDIGRLCFVSYDPEAYINTQAIARLTPPEINIRHSETPRKVTPSTTQLSKTRLSTELPGNDPVDCSDIAPHLQMEFQRCVNSVIRKIKYTQGQRDMYIYTLGNQCYQKAIPQEIAARLAQHRYGGDPDINIPQVIANAYQYTSRTDMQQEDKQKLVGAKLLEFMEKVCEARRNLVLESLEIRMKSDGGAGAAYRPIRKDDYNTLYLDAQIAGISCQPHIVRAVIDSRFARNFNPFEEYFYGLPAWDMEVDYIDRLAETMKTNNQAFWRDCFKRWLVGMVACALDNERENQLALIIKGAQGKGKSTWIRRLLPPELKLYYRNGKLNPNNKDHMLCLTQRILINLEEFEGMRQDEISELKRLISQDSVTERKAWGEETEVYIRRASFIASTNEPRFLEDITGTRRFPTVTAEEIDYKTPFDHAKVYAQALHLWKSGFRYWYEEEEFQALNDHNSQYVMASQEEELFYVYFRKPLPDSYSTQWMPVSAIMTELAIWGKLQANKQTQRNLIKILEKGDFRKRISDNKITEYEVVYINQHYRVEN